MTEPILRAARWKDNAALIAACSRLGYLRKDWYTLDPTYGPKGNWWTRWRPERLVTHDLRLDGVDYRHLPEDDATFDAVAWDPPYVAPGGRKSTGMAEMHSAYGMAGTPPTPALLQAMNDEGLAEIRRVVKPGGIVLAKCQDYVWSGRWFPGAHNTRTRAVDLGFILRDELILVTSPRPQPPRTRADGEPVRQHHSRGNMSNLLVLQKPKG